MGLNKLKLGVFKRQGRNNKGRITVYKRGGGQKRKLYLIDYKRDLIGIPARLVKILPEARRGYVVGLICYSCGYLSYIRLSGGMKVGDLVVTEDNFLVREVIGKIGNCVQIKNLKANSIVHNLELKPQRGAVISRAPGKCLRIMQSNNAVNNIKNHVMVRFNKKLSYFINGDCYAVRGRVLGHSGFFEEIGKAGVNRLMGIKPTVRGVAKNPIDHPHGGGQGKTKGGRCSVTPWGRLTRGKKTRNVRKINKKILRNKWV